LAVRHPAKKRGAGRRHPNEGLVRVGGGGGLGRAKRPPPAMRTRGKKLSLIEGIRGASALKCPLMATRSGLRGRERSVQTLVAGPSRERENLPITKGERRQSRALRQRDRKKVVLV